MKALEPAEPVRRYERAHPGEMIHLDIKKLGRFEQVGHRITGDRRGQSNRRARGEVAVDHTGLSSCNPMAYGTDPAELLDIDMDELARILTLIAANRLRLESAQFVQAQSTQNPADGGRRDAGLGRDLLAGPALAAQSRDLLDDLPWRWPA